MRALSPIPFFMVWNTFLALVPLGLAGVLFGRRARSTSTMRRGAGWWIGVAAFLVALPNAPYVLTDVVHLVEDAQDGVLIRTLLVYAAFFAVGVLAYTVSIAQFVAYLRRAGVGLRWLLGIEVGLHFVVATGVLIGRYGRWNSWDLGVRPVAVVAQSIGWASPRAVVAVVVLAGGLASITTMLRLAARGAGSALRGFRTA